MVAATKNSIASLSMIIVNMKGGLGNQLFQYALGRHLSLRHNVPLVLDASGLERANHTGDIYRPFSLQQFAIEARTATEAEVQRYKYPYGVLSKAWRFLSFKLSRDKNTRFRPNVLTQQAPLYLDGFWQSPRYFEPIRTILLKELVLRDPSKVVLDWQDRIRASSASVAIHVRRGDYIHNPVVTKRFGPCSLDYYKRALTHLRNHITTPTFYLFSDDPTWVVEHLPLEAHERIIVSDGILADFEELSLMSLCQHHIIANSSFSWWAAWLNQNSAKLVVAPTPWFDDQTYDDALIPATWIQLPK